MKAKRLRKHTTKAERIMKHWRSKLKELVYRDKRVTALAFVCLFGVIGITILFGVFADTGSELSVQPQSGTITGNASVVSDSTAIGGNALVFGNSTISSGVSPSGTVVMAGSSASITDSANNIWTVTGGVVDENGTPTVSSGVVEIAYVNGTVWQENSSSLWWSWNGSGWSPTGAGLTTSPLTGNGSSNTSGSSGGSSTTSGSGAGNTSSSNIPYSTCTNPIPTGATGYSPFNGFNIQTNEWDSGQPYTICNDDGGRNFQVTTSGINQSGGPPGSYSSLYVGDHWGTVTSGDPLPVQVSAMENNGTATGKVTTSYDSATINSGAWDDSYDIWYNQQSNSSENGAGNGSLEMMIWINHMGGVQPAGGPGPSVTIDGQAYTVWWSAPSNGNGGTVSYVLNNSQDTVSNLDLGAFAADAVSRGYMQPSWYLNDVEAGFEVWQGGVGLTVNNFIVNVN